MRLDVGVVRRAEHRDEQLGDHHLARCTVDDLDAVAREVDEEPLARAMLLAHRHR